ncbi:MAG: hypothetical protein DA328_09520 [Nitrososphaeraceae archaeon]|nr:hypothetical protein [Nitrososphaeraceae archaeon]
MDYVENDKPERILHDTGNNLHPERSDFLKEHNTGQTNIFISTTAGHGMIKALNKIVKNKFLPVENISNVKRAITECIAS